jgi:hypothetical protein
VTDPGAAARWAALPARERGALIRAVRRGERVAEADRPLAYEVATRELARINRNVRPGRLLVWRVGQGLLAVLFLFVAAAAVTAGDELRAAVFGALSAVVGSSALLARRRLDRQVARLTAARDMNAPPQGTPPEV